MGLGESLESFSESFRSWDSVTGRSQKSSCETSSLAGKRLPRVGRNVDKLEQMTEKCERLNSNLDRVVFESHKILDNSTAG